MLDHVLAPGAIGPLRLPHRVLMGSMHLGLEGLPDDGRALAAFYAERAAAGAALIVTGGSAVSRVGAAGRGYSLINEDRFRSPLARVAAEVHEAGGRILLQLFHAGRYAIPGAFGLQPVAPSAVYCALVRAEPRPLTGPEVRATIDDFSRGAARARELGFDGVEIMGSEGYLLNQFTAPATNRRDDEWGGDAQRRMAFALAVAEAVRAAAGPGAAVVYRISGADLVDGGASEHDVAELAARLADRGIDALNVGIGWHEARVPTVQGAVPPGAWAPWARALRERVDVPVIASNRINALSQAEELLARGDADFASLARPFLADPQLVAKARSTPARPVNVCIACDQACIDRSLFDERVSCLVNPRAGWEAEHGDARLSARVAVLGGGPAGMEAARALAVAGASVTLFETASRLGGQFRMACRIPGKEDYGLTIAYFEAELERLGVEVRLGARLHGDGGFDAHVVATGVVPRAVDIPGADLPHVHSYASLLDPDGPGPALGGAVAIVGAGGIGLDVAHLLSDRPGEDPLTDFYARYGLRGHRARADELSSPRPVTLMRRSGRIGQGVGPTTRWVTTGRLAQAGVTMLTGVAYERIEPGTLHIRDAHGAPCAIAADTVIVCAGQESHVPPPVPGVPRLAIGGAARAGELDAERAFRDGLQTPRRLVALRYSLRR